MSQYAREYKWPEILDMRRAMAQARKNRTCDSYRRPQGVMGGPCLNCGNSQPEHAKK